MSRAPLTALIIVILLAAPALGAMAALPDEVITSQTELIVVGDVVSVTKLGEDTGREHYIAVLRVDEVEKGEVPDDLRVRFFIPIGDELPPGTLSDAIYGVGDRIRAHLQKDNRADAFHDPSTYVTVEHFQGLHVLQRATPRPVPSLVTGTASPGPGGKGADPSVGLLIGVLLLGVVLGVLRARMR